MSLPLTQAELLRCVAAETARMSYPGSMSRGAKPIVGKGTKADLEEYFVSRFPIEEVWCSADTVANNYETWHHAQTKRAARAIVKNVRSNNVPMSVAAKFLNTFMDQLTKYEEARPLVPVLHLPLDTRVFAKLRRFESPALAAVRKFFNGSPYALPYGAHLKVQQALRAFIDELNARPG